MKDLWPRTLGVAAMALFPAMALAVPETEPNDSKAQANAIALPAVSTLAMITGNSTSATATGLDYFRVTTAAQAAPGFYRHRLIVQSTTPGHTATIRGLTQTAGVPNAGTDATAQTSSAATTPARFVQWYTSEAAADVYVRLAGTGTTTADYSLDYEVAPVTTVAGPASLTAGPITISTIGQTTADTDLWVYDSNRLPIATFGNDDESAAGGGTGATSQSILTRTYTIGSYTMAITNFNFANDQGSPVDDDFRTGTVLDFPGALLNSSTGINQDMDSTIGGIPVTATKTGPYDVVFVTFDVPTPVELQGFSIE